METEGNMEKADSTGKRTGIMRNLFRENYQGYLFIAPAAILISVFGIFPMFFTVFVSMHKWRMRRGQFLFLDNFVRIFGSYWYILLIILLGLIIYFGMKLWNAGKERKLRAPEIPGKSGSVQHFLGIIIFFSGLLGLFILIPNMYQSGDSNMMDSLRVTIWYSLGTVPIQLFVGLLVAVLLDQKFRGKQAFRVTFLLPYIVPSVASATIFERLFSLRSESFANQVLIAFGREPLQWLLEPSGIFSMMFGKGGSEGLGVIATYLQTWVQGPSLALVSIMFFNWWVFVGYYSLIFANGLAQISKDIYDAAEMDGAPKRTVFFKIIVPLLSPTTYFLSMLGIIGTFKAFNHIYVLRNPAARGAADPMSIHIFFTFFRKSRFGYAAAMALLLFIIVLGLTLLQRRIMEKRVFYGE